MIWVPSPISGFSGTPHMPVSWSIEDGYLSIPKHCKGLNPMMKGCWAQTVLGHPIRHCSCCRIRCSMRFLDCKKPNMFIGDAEHTHTHPIHMTSQNWMVETSRDLWFPPRPMFPSWLDLPSPWQEAIWWTSLGLWGPLLPQATLGTKPKWQRADSKSNKTSVVEWWTERTQRFGLIWICQRMEVTPTISCWAVLGNVWCQARRSLSCIPASWTCGWLAFEALRSRGFHFGSRENRYKGGRVGKSQNPKSL